MAEQRRNHADVFWIHGRYCGGRAIAEQVRIDSFADELFRHVGYAFTKMMEATAYLNDSDALPYETLSGSHRPHRLTFDAIWELLR